MRTFYPRLNINNTYELMVSNLHKIHIQESGNPDGVPVLFNHGGPGAGIGPDHGRQFDPEWFRLVQFDQRGAGRSTPYADIRENRTEDLIADIEKIRSFLGIEKWIVAGRSRGTTLSLLYAEQYPERVAALFLPAIFLCDKQSIHWLFQEGASHIYPEEWEEFSSLVSHEKRHDNMVAYREMLFGDDRALAIKAAQAWSRWEAHTCSVLPDPELVNSFVKEEVSLALSRFECHYLSQGGFIEEGQIIRDAQRIAHIPTYIIHGRYDMNCTLDNAYRLHRALPASQLIVVKAGGHAANDEETIHCQVLAADALKTIVW